MNTARVPLYYLAQIALGAMGITLVMGYERVAMGFALVAIIGYQVPATWAIRETLRRDRQSSLSERQ